MKSKVIYLVFALCAIVLLSIKFINISIEENKKGKQDIEVSKNIENKDNKKAVANDNEEVKDEKKEDELKEKETVFQEYEVSKFVVTRALVSKLISLALFDKSDIISMDREIKFEDTTPDKWYDKYINCAVVNGYIKIDGFFFEPNELLTNREAKNIFKKIKNDLDMSNIADDDNPISAHDFTNLYLKMIEQDDTVTGIYKSDLIVLGTPMNCKELDSWKMATDRGIYNIEGFAVDQWIDNKVKFVTKGTEILAVLNKIEDEPVLTNAYVTSVKDDSIGLYVKGVSRKYNIKKKSDIVVDDIVDLQLKKDEADNIVAKRDFIIGKVMRINDELVEIDSGSYELTDDMKVYYNNNGSISSKNTSNIIVGTKSTEFILKDNKICAAVIKDRLKTRDIRVAIHKTGYKGLVHTSVSLSSDDDYIVSYGDNEKIYKGNKIFKVDSSTNAELFGYDRIYIKPSEAGKIQLRTVERAQGSPSYSGVIEIAKDEGGYTVINEIDIEDYLYAVVPSEMPSSHGVEASKAQAITARSYAYNQIYSNRFHKYGAHVDDSTSCQVYNNYAATDTSKKAVDQTKGMGLSYKGAIVSANYFSTSCGFTANSGDVWVNGWTKQFPNTTPEYLSSKAQFEGDDYKEIVDEDTFYKFLTDENIDAYDKEFGWYRWNVKMTREEIEASIKSNIKKQYDARPKVIKTLDENKVFRNREIGQLGDLKDIHVYKRGDGGIITELVIEFSNCTLKILTEYCIRSLLKPIKYLEDGEDIILSRNDGHKYKNHSTMPSAFFVMEKLRDKEGKLLSINFLGGGFGHGVGMSQNGVKGMVDRGYNYKQILEHYYKGIEIKSIF